MGLFREDENLIISPVRDTAHHERITEALDWVNARHGATLKRLAE